MGYLGLPDIADKRWRQLLLSDKAPRFQVLATQLMFSSVKMMAKADPNPNAFLAAATTITNYFEKNQIRVQTDLEFLIKEMEQKHD